MTTQLTPKVHTQNSRITELSSRNGVFKE